MKRILIITLLVIGGLLWLQTVRLRDERAERRRVQSNNEVLTDALSSSTCRDAACFPLSVR